MGITVKHVVVAAVIFAVVGFVYVIGFSEIDPVRSPRARALDARATVGRLIGNVRGGMASGQGRLARAAGDELIVHYPDDPRSWLNRGYAYRFRSWDADRAIERDSWGQLLRIVEGWDPEMRGFEVYGNALYFRGWALRGLGRMEESRADFLELAMATEESAGLTAGLGSGNSSVIRAGINTAMAYNLACYWAVAGETERALMYWEACVEGGYNLSTGVSGGGLILILRICGVMIGSGRLLGSGRLSRGLMVMLSRGMGRGLVILNLDVIWLGGRVGG